MDDIHIAQSAVVDVLPLAINICRKFLVQGVVATTTTTPTDNTCPFTEVIASFTLPIDIFLLIYKIMKQNKNGKRETKHKPTKRYNKLQESFNMPQ